MLPPYIAYRQIYLYGALSKLHSGKTTEGIEDLERAILAKDRRAIGIAKNWLAGDVAVPAEMLAQIQTSLAPLLESKGGLP